MKINQKIYAYLIDSKGNHCHKNSDADTDKSTSEKNSHVAQSFVTLIVINVVSKLASQMANTKTALPWLASSMGVPPFIIGLFVPIRESLSLIPQVVFAGLIERYPKQRFYLMVSLLGQGLSILLLVALTLDVSGLMAGMIMLACISLFALSRCVTSIVSKDILGLLIPKSQRGQLTGTSASAAGFFTLVIGMLMATGILNVKDSAVWLLVFSSVIWMLASAICLCLSRPQKQKSQKEDVSAKVASFFNTLKNTPALSYFICTRAFMVGSALSAPYILLLSKSEASGAPSAGSLGVFITVSGVASLVSARIWGRFADTNSRSMMRLTAMLTAIICAVASATAFWGDQQPLWVIALIFFVLSVIHQGVRIARKTYIVDLADDDQRLRFVSLSNTAIGIVILAIGGLTAAIAQWSVPAVLALLSVMALFAMALTAKLPEVS